MDNYLIRWLQDWYANQCDGDWEHEHGVKINTLDNPGWDINIDIINTGFKKDLPWKHFEIADNNWFGYKIENGYFNASGDPAKLEFLIQVFKDFIDHGEGALPNKQTD